MSWVEEAAREGRGGRRRKRSVAVPIPVALLACQVLDLGPFLLPRSRIFCSPSGPTGICSLPAVEVAACPEWIYTGEARA
jgi:hypothetical protein